MSRHIGFARCACHTHAFFFSIYIYIFFFWSDNIWFDIDGTNTLQTIKPSRLVHAKHVYVNHRFFSYFSCEIMTINPTFLIHLIISWTSYCFKCCNHIFYSSRKKVQNDEKCFWIARVNSIFLEKGLMHQPRVSSRWLIDLQQLIWYELIVVFTPHSHSSIFL